MRCVLLRPFYPFSLKIDRRLRVVNPDAFVQQITPCVMMMRTDATSKEQIIREVKEWLNKNGDSATLCYGDSGKMMTPTAVALVGPKERMWLAAPRE